MCLRQTQTHYTETISGFHLRIFTGEPLVADMQYTPVYSRVRCAARRPASALFQPGVSPTLRKDTKEGARQRLDFLPTPPLIGSWACKKPVNERLALAETCGRSLGGIVLSSSSTRRRADLGEDEVVLYRAHRRGGAGRLLRLHPPAQLRVRSLEADAAGRDFPERTASGETQPSADSLSLLLGSI